MTWVAAAKCEQSVLRKMGEATNFFHFHTSQVAGREELFSDTFFFSFNRWATALMFLSTHNKLFLCWDFIRKVFFGRRVGKEELCFDEDIYIYIYKGMTGNMIWSEPLGRREGSVCRNIETRKSQAEIHADAFCCYCFVQGCLAVDIFSSKCKQRHPFSMPNTSLHLGQAN